MFYYEEGNPHKVFSPDVMFVRGVGKHPRRDIQTLGREAFSASRFRDFITFDVGRRFK